MTEVWGSTRQHSTRGVRHAPGTPCWTSLLAHDLESIKSFYSGLFGWAYYNPGPRRLGPYVRATIDGQDVAGIGGPAPGRRLPSAWTTYLASDDADRTAEWIRSSCGTVGVGPLAAENAGRLVLACDPAGAPFGVWQGERPAQPAGAPGTPARHELVTRRASSVVAFYQGLFGYETDPVDPAGADSLTLRLAGRPVAVIHGVGAALPRTRGPHWMTSFEVPDTDAAARRVTELGGRVLTPPHESAAGRVATVADPEGAVFTVLRSAR
ncbi:VOC family protein [Streptomyces sp. UNOC14_S4]|uniref:VOC family protein n=1 Tax=Streptomyces sp. UNOC14_S4 TaxID=2872340 RepID=UPI001E3CEF63|nr:VOC family protein [Streptomyces sp. UNOC14_S4]MCC3767492.1 VOC family protein [Streptomyces sp. UNOC14_S4]